MEVSSIIEALNALTPLGLAGGLGYVIYLLVKGKTSADVKVETIASNHLHGLPEMLDILREMNDTLHRMDRTAAENFAYLKARLNGHQ